MEKRNGKIVWMGISFFVLGLGLFFGGDVVREAWAQARTVLYKDFAQTVTVAHTFNNATPASPPFTIGANSAGVAVPGLAFDRFGDSTIAGLGSAATAGKARRLTDGGATGAMVFSDGTNWNCDDQKDQGISIVTCPPYNAKGDGVTDDKDAFTAAIGAGGKTVYVPPGTFIVRTLLMMNGTRLIGAGMGVTTLKVKAGTQSGIIANTIDSLITDVEIAHMTMDGNGALQTPPGSVVVGGNATKRWWLHHLHVKDSVEYCIGFEHGPHNDLKMSDLTVENCRRDGIDIKNKLNTNSSVEMENITIRNPGITIGIGGGATGEPDSVCIDQRGSTRINNVSCFGLVAALDGIRFHRDQGNEGNDNCVVAFCNGAETSSISNFYIQGDGTTTTGAGIRVRDDHVHVSNGYVQGMGRGVWIESAGVGFANHALVSNVTARANRSAGFEAGALGAFATFSSCTAIGTVAGPGFKLISSGHKVIGSTATGGTGPGVEIQANVSNTKIIGGLFSNNTTHGITVAAGATNSIINANTIEGNDLGGISDAGTTTRIQNNVGVITSSGGSGTITSGSTFVQLNHGLTFQPLPSDIMVTLNENPTNAPVAVWISDITPNTFRVNVGADPGASNLDFGWSAINKR